MLLAQGAANAFIRSRILDHLRATCLAYRTEALARRSLPQQCKLLCFLHLPRIGKWEGRHAALPLTLVASSGTVLITQRLLGAAERGHVAFSSLTPLILRLKLMVAWQACYS